MAILALYWRMQHLVSLSYALNCFSLPPTILEKYITSNYRNSGLGHVSYPFHQYTFRMEEGNSRSYLYKGAGTFQVLRGYSIHVDGVGVRHCFIEQL